MKPLIYALTIASLTAPTVAHARNVRDYKCGETEVNLGIAKDSGTVIGTSIGLTVRDSATSKRFTRVTVVYGSIEDPPQFFLDGKSYRCTEIPGD